MEGIELKNFSPSTVMKLMRAGVSPYEAYVKIVGHDPSEVFSNHPNDGLIWTVLLHLARKIQRERIQKARTPIKDLGKVTELIQNSKKIIVIIGAGASIGPDFRSPGGLYDTIAKEEGLEDPYHVFDLEYFKKDPTLFWKYAHMIFPDKNPKHSETHYFIKHLQEQGKLIRLYSQNVDTLECDMPKELLRCVHGSWRDSKCLKCGKVFGIEEMRPYVETKLVPVCPECGGEIQPGIVFFGQRTNIEDVDITHDSENGDLLIVVGTSLRVAPISMIPNIMAHIPSILINLEPVTCSFSVELLGDCSKIVKYIERKLGWVNDKESEVEEPHFNEPNRFIFHGKDGNISRTQETGLYTFLITPTEPNPEDLE
jgi:NAD-dependent SIR2 family protein deacetylase